MGKDGVSSILFFQLHIMLTSGKGANCSPVPLYFFISCCLDTGKRYSIRHVKTLRCQIEIKKQGTCLISVLECRTPYKHRYRAVGIHGTKGKITPDLHCNGIWLYCFIVGHYVRSSTHKMATPKELFLRTRYIFVGWCSQILRLCYVTVG